VNDAFPTGPDAASEIRIRNTEGTSSLRLPTAADSLRLHCDYRRLVMRPDQEAHRFVTFQSRDTAETTDGHGKSRLQPKTLNTGDRFGV
jgi:hypothetical protein